MQIDEIHALQSVGALDSTKICVQEHELVLKQPQLLKYSLFHHVNQRHTVSDDFIYGPFIELS